MAKNNHKKLIKLLRQLNKQTPVSTAVPDSTAVTPSKNIWRLLFEKFLAYLIAPTIVAIGGNLFILYYSNNEPSELDEVIGHIDNVVSKLENSLIVEDTAYITKHPEQKIVRELKLKVNRLLLYRGAHEVCEFKGATLDESLILTKDNLNKRNTFDRTAHSIMDVVDDYYQYGLHSNLDYIMDLEQQKCLMEKKVKAWVNKDTLNNIDLICRIDKNLASNNQVKKKELKMIYSELASVKNDISHYYFLSGLYDFLLEIYNRNEYDTKTNNI